MSYNSPLDLGMFRSQEEFDAARRARGYSTGSTGSADSTGSAGSAGSAGSLGGMMGDRVNGSSTSVGSAVLDIDDETLKLLEQQNNDNEAGIKAKQEQERQQQEQWLRDQQQQDEYYRNQHDANPGIYIPGNSYSNSSSSTGGNGSNYPSMTSIVVRKGDSLWTLVRQVLGKNASYLEIARVVNETAKSNNIENPNRIYPGQVIRIRTN